jgi:hypothetical protein
MGYYNNLQVSAQADPDRIVAWYKSSGKTLPPYLHDWLLERDERVWGAIKAWENQPVAKKVAEVITRAPKPASEHVALQPQTRRDARALAQSSEVITFTKSDYRLLVGAVLAFGVTAIGLLLWIARLL